MIGVLDEPGQISHANKGKRISVQFNKHECKRINYFTTKYTPTKDCINLQAIVSKMTFKGNDKFKELLRRPNSRYLKTIIL